MTKLRGLILDLDGILVDSESLWNEAGIMVFDRLGVHMTQEQVSETMGMWIGDSVAYWYSQSPWSGPSIEEVTEEWVRTVTHLVQTRAAPMPGALDVVSMAREMGWPVGIASSSPLPYVQAVVDLFGLPLDAVCSAEVEEYGKPHPAVFLAAAKAMGAPPEGCVVIEDSTNGVIAAKAARMRCIAMPDPRLRGRREFCIADAVVSALMEITREMLVGP